MTVIDSYRQVHIPTLEIMYNYCKQTSACTVHFITVPPGHIYQEICCITLLHKGMLLYDTKKGRGCYNYSANRGKAKEFQWQMVRGVKGCWENHFQYVYPLQKRDRQNQHAQSDVSKGNRGARINILFRAGSSKVLGKIWS